MSIALRGDRPGNYWWGGLMWAPYLALGWGMGVALDAWNTFYLSGDRYEDAFQRWRRKRLLRRSIHSLFNRWFKG